ncbi:MAG: hypothetical protein BGO14_10480 [Chlamydiales bacterium 38-26]|nr:ABC transporter ATP-binding protein [Chlamydiales bacterium]OJV11382.1 MAG: hypothetical protein BGO14_10480 [Chlamydiales bacterium 38-26]
MRTKELAVKCEHLIKSYGDGDIQQIALKDISLEFYTGELTFLMGASGCGKTTLLSLISTILKENSGFIEIFGQKVNQMTDAEKTLFRCEYIGFLFQNFYLIPSLSCVENIELPLLLQEKPEEFARKRAKEALEEIGILSLADRWPHELSGGQQQRIALARAIVHRPKLIICDEPTSALDHANGIIVMDLLRGHALNPGNAVIVATHDRRILEYADRVIELDDGKIDKIYEMPKS